MERFRPLRADEVEARVSTITEKGLSLLLYKDARCDMNILDEVIKPENWQRRHYECKGNLYCSIGIRCADEWVWKDDCGTESYTEKEKGEASDSFKRAAFNWGIGRELYTAPFIWVLSSSSDGKPNYRVEQKGDRLSTRDKFKVTHLAVSDGKITGINIENPKLHKTVYVFGTIFEPMEKCSFCDRAVKPDVAKKSIEANGKIFCSGTCRDKEKTTHAE